MLIGPVLRTRLSALFIFASLLTLSLSVPLTGCGSGGTASSSSTSTSATTLTSTATSAVTGTSITLTATVTPAATSGTVTFYDGTTSLGTGTVSSGQATFTTTALAVGTHSITAAFAGNGTYAASTSSALSITITAATTTSTLTTLTTSAASASVGTSITLTATLNPLLATGTVTFYDGSTSIGTATLASGVATANTSALAAGTHSVTAVYGGSSTYATSTSSAVTITITAVGATATTTMLAASSTSVASGVSVTLTATVLPSTATGTVTFYSGTTSLGTATLTSGSALLATTALPTGTDSVTATYAGSTSYSTSTSAAITVTVTASTSSSCSTLTGTAQIVCLTTAFEATLTTTQIATLQQSLTKANIEHWSNLPLAVIARNGLQFSTLSSTQLTAALAIAQASLSSDGYTRLANIRAADDNIATVSSMYQWGSGNYFIAFYGTPSTTGAWMLQINGHHFAFNKMYNATYVSGTPYFIGVEPPTFTLNGTTIQSLEKQRAAMYALSQSIYGTSAAVLSGTFDDVVHGIDGSTSIDSDYPAAYPTGTTGRGILASSLTAAQQTLIKTVIEAWVNDMDSTTAASLISTYEDSTALANTYVGYSGDGTLTKDNDYIRIDGPRIWIEFVVQQGVAYPTTYHFHTIWRDKTADYGAEF